MTSIPPASTIGRCLVGVVRHTTQTATSVSSSVGCSFLDMGDGKVSFHGVDNNVDAAGLANRRLVVVVVGLDTYLFCKEHRMLPLLDGNVSFACSFLASTTASIPPDRAIDAWVASLKATLCVEHHMHIVGHRRYEDNDGDDVDDKKKKKNKKTCPLTAVKIQSLHCSFSCGGLKEFLSQNMAPIPLDLDRSDVQGHQLNDWSSSRS